MTTVAAQWYRMISGRLFMLGLIGVRLLQSTILMVLMSIERMLLAVNLQFITWAVYLDDVLGQVTSMMILTVAAGESSIGLAILVAYFRVRGGIDMNTIGLLRG
jgi:NADH-quinone oxidoreductase subunit K